MNRMKTERSLDMAMPFKTESLIKRATQSSVENQQSKIVDNAIHRANKSNAFTNTIMPKALLNYRIKLFCEVCEDEKLSASKKIAKMQAMIYDLIIDDVLSEEEKYQLKELFIEIMASVGTSTAKTTFDAYRNLIKKVLEDDNMSGVDKYEKIRLIELWVKEDPIMKGIEDFSRFKFRVRMLIDKAYEDLKKANTSNKPE